MTEPAPLTDAEAAHVRRWARKQFHAYVVVCASTLGVAYVTGGWFGIALAVTAAVLVAVAIARWRWSRTFVAGLPTVILEGRWRPGGRTTGAQLGAAQVDGVIAAGPRPAYHANARARAFGLDHLGKVIVTQSYVIVTWEATDAGG